MTSSPRYTSLRDYLRVLRDHRILIVAMTVVFGAVTYAISATSEKSYTATASVALNSPQQAYALAGLGAAQTPPIPLQTPAINAASVTTGPILRPAALRLKRSLPHAPLGAILGGLYSSVSADVSASTNLVLISASAGQPKLAADIANAVATSDANYTTQQLRGQLRQIAAGLSTRLSAGGSGPAGTFAREQNTATIARLQGLAKVLSGAQVSSPAVPPGSASSPKSTRNAVLAALVGLTLAIVIAFLHASLDRRVRTAAQIQRELEMSLLGRVPQSAMGGVGPLAQGRRKMAPEDLEAFRILRANLDLLADEDLKTIAITSPLPDQGKSTVASSLAFASAWAGRRTLLVETDLRRRTLAGRAGLKATPGLTELLRGYVAGGSAPFERYVQSVPAVSAGGQGSNGATAQPVGALDVLTAGTAPQMPAELLGGPAFEELLGQARARYDTVILDTSPLLPVADTLEILPLVDGILICVRAGRTRAEELRSVRSALEHLPQRTLGFVLTGVGAGDEADYGYYAPVPA